MGVELVEHNELVINHHKRLEYLLNRGEGWWCSCSTKAWLRNAMIERANAVFPSPTSSAMSIPVQWSGWGVLVKIFQMQEWTPASWCQCKTISYRKPGGVMSRLNKLGWSHGIIPALWRLSLNWWGRQDRGKPRLVAKTEGSRSCSTSIPRCQMLYLWGRKRVASEWK